MKITLTYAEITAIVVKHLDLADVPNISIEISNGSMQAASKTMSDIVKFDIHQIESFINANEKIKAIKHFRTLTGCSLKQGKDVIENWAYAKEQMRRFDSLVLPHYKNDDFNISEWRLTNRLDVMDF